MIIYIVINLSFINFSLTAPLMNLFLFGFFYNRGFSNSGKATLLAFRKVGKHVNDRLLTLVYSKVDSC